MIVGTDLKRIERITGRLTNGRVALGGALSGAWLGPVRRHDLHALHRGRVLATLLSTVLFGAVVRRRLGARGYAATRGQRDFSSVTQVVATRYEVLVEHKVAAQARELLAGLPGATARPVRLSGAVGVSPTRPRPPGPLPRPATVGQPRHATRNAPARPPSPATTGPMIAQIAEHRS